MKRLLTIYILAVLTACGTSPKVADKTTAPDDKRQNEQLPPQSSSSQPANTSIATGTEQEPGNNTQILNPVLPPPVQTPFIPAPVVTPPPAAAQGTWKVLLMTGDDSINAFDNARKKIKEIWTGMGVRPENIRELSVKEPGGNVQATNRQNIQQALQSLRIGQGDKCLIHMTSHGSRDGFFLRGQATLRPDEFNQMLDATCGQQPTVVLVSACYSGVFIKDANLTKPNRIILTAARYDRTSFGCGVENQYTYWDNCLIDNMNSAGTWQDLQTKIVSCINAKESGGSFSSSLPQSFFGSVVSNLTFIR